MGKKKGGKHSGKHDAKRRPEDPEARAAIPPQVADIAAAMLRQVNTPAFQHLIAGALGAAGKAIEQMGQRSATDSSRSGPKPPVPPESPVAPEPKPAAEPQPGYRPSFETPPINLSPEAAEAIGRVAHHAAEAIERAAGHAAQAIETAAAGLERWVEARKPGPPDA